MKKVISVAAGLLFLSSSMAFAASNVKGVVVNKSNVKDAANVAVGLGNTANMGSIQLKNANVKGVVVNKSNVQDAANVAVGLGNTANMGSVVVE